MLKFAELLKQAQRGRVQILHEYLTNYDPSKNRLHCFYEGREDEVFYRHFISSRTKARLLPYICGNKDEVYAVLSSILTHSDCGQTLFFVDKDLSDVMKEKRAEHDRLFVSSLYSVENYSVSGDLFSRFCQDYIQCRGVTCVYEDFADDFTLAVWEFYQSILPIMAWVVAVRRRGQKPNLRNLKLSSLFDVSSDLKAKKRGRMALLCEETQIAPTPKIAVEIKAALKELKTMEIKKVVRGHFESWFFVEYLKRLFIGLKSHAETLGGSVVMSPPVEHSNFVALAVPFVTIPPELDAFLSRNL